MVDVYRHSGVWAPAFLAGIFNIVAVWRCLPIYVFLLLFYGTAFAQHHRDRTDGVYHITAYTSNKDHLQYLNDTVRAILFVQEKGSLTLPQYSQKVHLSAHDAKKFGTDTLRVVFINKLDLAEPSRGWEDELYRLEIQRLPGVDHLYLCKNSLYFDANNQVKLSDNLYFPENILKKPTAADTVDITYASSPSFDSDFRYLPEWIKRKNAGDRMMVREWIVTETGINYSGYENHRISTLAELAQVRLEVASRTLGFLNAPSPDDSRERWQAWLDGLLALKPHEVGAYLKTHPPKPQSAPISPANDRSSLNFSKKALFLAAVLLITMVSFFIMMKKRPR